MDVDPKSLDRAGRGVVPCGPVSEAVLWREWLDSVRGRVGAALPVRWNAVRSATGLDLRAMFEARRSPADAAAALVARWSEIRGKGEACK